MDLKALQQQFMLSIENQTSEIERWVKASHGLSAKDRLAIYRRSAKGNLIEALRFAYPVIERLVGNDCFNEVCEHFIQGHTHHSPDLMHYGAGLDAFLPTCPTLHGFDYLADVATLEWAIHCAKDAQITQPCTAQVLAQMDSTAQQQIQFSLSNGAQLVSSPFPIKQIWAQNQNGVEDVAISLTDGGDRLLVILEHDGVALISLSQYTFMLLCLMRQYSLSMALECFIGHVNQDPAPVFAKCIQNGWLTLV